MKPHPRIRKTVKWGGAVVCLLLIAAWIVSTRWTVYWSSTRMQAGIHAGMLGTGGPHGTRAIPQSGWLAHRRPAARLMGWLPSWVNTQAHWNLSIPLWMLLLPTLLITIAAWRRDMLARRRAMTGLCPKCRYDRAGLSAGAVCPECGAAAPVQITNT